jgi:hypothetical protein
MVIVLLLLVKISFTAALVIAIIPFLLNLITAIMMGVNLIKNRTYVGNGLGYVQMNRWHRENSIIKLILCTFICSMMLLTVISM